MLGLQSLINSFNAISSEEYCGESKTFDFIGTLENAMLNLTPFTLVELPTFNPCFNNLLDKVTIVESNDNILSFEVKYRSLYLLNTVLKIASK